MTGELEAAAADSITDVFRPRRKKPFDRQGQPCANCGAPLEGWYCHSCGQNADTHHRSILHLIWEAIEGMFHLDGRLAKTLPLLLFRPGVLAKDYMEGRIARHVPPFRTFLVALLLFIFAAEHAIHKIKHHQEVEAEHRAAELATPQGRAKEAGKLRAEAVETRDEALKEAAIDRDEALKDPDQDKAKVAASYVEDVQEVQDRYAERIAKADAIEKDPKVAQELSRKLTGKAAADKIRSLKFEDGPDALEAQAQAMAEDSPHGRPVTKPALTYSETQAHSTNTVHFQSSVVKGNWLKERTAKAVENPDYYLLVMFGWAHRLAVLLLPIIGLSLALVYVNKRQYFIYDHLLVATNLLSFSFLTNAVGMVLPAPLIAPWFVLLAFWTPINLFQTLRGGYGSSIFGALLKTFIVWFMSVTAFTLLVVGLMIFTLYQM
ncbi:DUF3667 domain-containing protein [Caulobacter sp.]|uniref:DUF3667 domain-containing protein n=1 Tax=Caulobacter sp. TaxID=78 RepID=UPI003BAB26F6